jgi:hypothetical protein
VSIASTSIGQACGKTNGIRAASQGDAKRHNVTKFIDGEPHIRRVFASPPPAALISNL